MLALPPSLSTFHALLDFHTHKQPTVLITTSNMGDINITSQKSSFLTSQIRLLNTPLTTPTSNIPATTLDPVITKINKKISAHNRLVFGLQSQRHVAEQISQIYYRDVLAHGLPVLTDDNGTTVKRDTDLTNGEEIQESLGEEWEDVVLRPAKRRRVAEDQRDQDERDVGTHENSTADNHEQDAEQAQRYRDLREKLLAQTRRREELTRKVAQYKKLQDLLRPLEKARENVQPNLVTKDNKELEGELARMRVLLARVGNAIQQAEPRGETGTSVQEVAAMTAEKKLEGLLALG